VWSYISHHNLPIFFRLRLRRWLVLIARRPQRHRKVTQAAMRYPEVFEYSKPVSGPPNGRPRLRSVWRNDLRGVITCRRVEHLLVCDNLPSAILLGPHVGEAIRHAVQPRMLLRYRALGAGGRCRRNWRRSRFSLASCAQVCWPRRLTTHVHPRLLDLAVTFSRRPAPCDADHCDADLPDLTSADPRQS
jgi:hypothetical protein